MSGRSTASDHPDQDRRPQDPAALEAVSAVMAPIIGEAGLDVEDVRLSPAGGRLLLRVLVDTDGGVTLDQVADLSRSLSAAIEDSQAMGARSYVLDVGSPGVDRPLTLRRHWRRNAGRLVRITGSDGSARVGRIVGVSGEADDAAPDSIDLEIGGAVVTVRAADIRKAVVQVEFVAAREQED